MASKSGVLRVQQDARQLGIEVAAGAPAHHGGSGGATVAVVGDLDDVSDLVEAHGQDHRLALHLAGRAAPVPPLAHLLEGVHDARARSDDLGQLRRRVADRPVELLDVVVVGDDAAEDAQAPRQRGLRRDPLQHASRAAQRIVDAEHRHRVAHRAVVAGTDQALFVREAGPAQVREQRHPVGVAERLDAGSGARAELDSQNRRANGLARRIVVRDVECQR